MKETVNIFPSGLRPVFTSVYSKRGFPFLTTLSLGLGYARVKYDRFRCTSCGKKDSKGKADYLGPTKLAVSIIYIIK